MGKNMQHSDSVMSIQNGPPGCMWGVLHILKYHHWSHIKKKIPYKKAINGRFSWGVANPGNDMKASKSDGLLYDHSSENENPSVDEKMTHSSPAARNSVKSRLKSLISEEVYKMKGRHRSTSSCTLQSLLMRTDSIHHLDPSDELYFPADMALDSESPLSAKNADNENFFSPTLEDSNAYEDQNLEDCSTVLGGNNSSFDATGKQLFADDPLILEKSEGEGQNLVHEQKLNMGASTYQSREILDAFDIINKNREYFLQVLQDPGSPFAHHFHNQQTRRSRRAYSKSLSFSSCSSSPFRGFGTRKLNPLKETVKSELHCKPYGRSQSMPSVPAEFQTTQRRKKNQAVIKRFKNLKEKIKHVIGQSKKEKHRIALDGILDKIPRGQELPKEFKTENLFAGRDDNNDSPRSSCESQHSIFSVNKTGSHCISRTPSLSESLDKYCQLYESSCKGDVKPKYVEPLKLKSEDSTQKIASKPMRRLSSSPELKSYIYFNEDSSDALPSGPQVRNGADANASTSDFSEQSDSGSLVKIDNQQNLDSDTMSVYEDRQETTAPVSDIHAKLNLVSDSLSASQDKQDAELSEPNSFQDDNASRVSFSSAEEEDLTLRISIPFCDELDNLEDKLIMKEIQIAAETGIDNIEIPNKHNIHFQVGAKDKAEFDYVKDILELSGFSKNEQLGTWHSDGQPMDPSLFDEVAGCMFLDHQETSGIEEDGGYPCYHLLLFDLINQVLMELYARSYTYFPTALSTLSRIRPMPVGYRVLEEVWANISGYLSSPPPAEQLLDYIVSRDLVKCDGWMNLQFDCECVGLEVEDIIFDDLLEEIISSL